MTAVPNAQDPRWVATAKKNLTDLYENRPLDRTPFEFIAHEGITGHVEGQLAMHRNAKGSVAEWEKRLFDTEFAIQEQLGGFAKRVDTPFVDDTIHSIGVLNGTMGWFNEVFGGTNEWFANRPPYPYPLIREPHEVDTLKPDLDASRMFTAAIAQMRHAASLVGDRIPVRAPDLQSPCDFASMIMDYTNLVMLMMDDPKRAHALLTIVTETLIAAMHRVQAEMVTDWPVSSHMWWLPRGTFLSDDLMAVLSPDLYAEYGVKYNEIVAAEFGGLALHSCGKIQHQFENLRNTKGLFAVNTHETIARAAAGLRNHQVVITGGVTRPVAPTYPGSPRDLLKTGAEVAAYWWEDFETLPTIRGQRYLYQCSALLDGTHTPREAYDRMLAFSQANLPLMQG